MKLGINHTLKYVSTNGMKLRGVCFVLSIKVLLISGKLNKDGNVCGKAFGAGFGEEKIVGGFDIGYYKYPWYAALVTGNVVACGGSFIGSKAIVSAAHCFGEYLGKTKLEDAYNVTLGIYNRCRREKSERIFFVQKVHVHEKYKSNQQFYDISLLILKENPNYHSICLPKSVIKPRPREGTVPGLGTLKYHGSTPCTLHEARLLIYSDSECRSMINRTGDESSKLYKVFCAGYLQGGIDTRQGDSGGPFQITDKRGNYILLGVVSFGYHCANPNLLGVYTDVSEYVDWIEHKVGHPAETNHSTVATTSKTTKRPDDAQTQTHINKTATKSAHSVNFRDKKELKVMSNESPHLKKETWEN